MNESDRRLWLIVATVWFVVYLLITLGLLPVPRDGLKALALFGGLCILICGIFLLWKE